MSEAQLPADARVPANLAADRSAAGRSTGSSCWSALLAELERRYDAFERDGFTGLERDELRGRHVTLVGGGERHLRGRR